MEPERGGGGVGGQHRHSILKQVEYNQPDSKAICLANDKQTLCEEAL